MTSVMIVMIRLLQYWYYTSNVNEFTQRYGGARYHIHGKINSNI